MAEYRIILLEQAESHHITAIRNAKTNEIDVCSSRSNEGSGYYSHTLLFRYSILRKELIWQQSGKDFSIIISLLEINISEFCNKNKAPNGN